MDYTESINYIESLSVFGSKPGFERINALLDELGHPEKGLNYIHIAGTNGKGSVSTETANILTAAGYRTGLFTSPFVSDFRERIQFCGEFIEKDALSELTSLVKKSVDRLTTSGIQPTEFEVITAIAFLFFKSKNCDIVVLEVGLGGLLDSTNVIEKPLISAITSLSLDHTAVLGDTIEKIAVQKAGIIKDGGITISAPEQPEEALHIIRTSAFAHDNKFIVADSSKIEEIEESIFGKTVSYNDNIIKLRLIGPHQIKNLSLSLTIIDELKDLGYKIPDKAIKAGLESTNLPARIEVISEKPLTIIDGGHNEDGTRVLSETLYNLIPRNNCTLVVGVMADKDIEHVLENLSHLASRIITTTPSNSRAMRAEKLAEKAKEFCKEVYYEDNPCRAFDLAQSITDSDGCILVCGSLYLAGDVRDYIIKKLK